MVRNIGINVSREMAIMSLRPSIDPNNEKGELLEADVSKEIERLEKKGSKEELRKLYKITNTSGYEAYLVATIDGLVETLDSLTTTVSRLEARIVALEPQKPAPIK